MLATAESEVADAAAVSAGAGDVDEPLDLVCTIEELASIVGRSVPTIRRDIAERGAPVISRGTNGVGYQISARAYQGWLAGEGERERRETEERIRKAAQLKL